MVLARVVLVHERPDLVDHCAVWPHRELHREVQAVQGAADHWDVGFCGNCCVHRRVIAAEEHKLRRIERVLIK